MNHALRSGINQVTRRRTITVLHSKKVRSTSAFVASVQRRYTTAEAPNLDFEIPAYLSDPTDPISSPPPKPSETEKNEGVAIRPNTAPTCPIEEEIFNKAQGHLQSGNYALARVIIEDSNPPATSVLHATLAQIKFIQARQLASSISTLGERQKFLRSLKIDVNMHRYSNSLVGLYLNNARLDNIRVGRRMFDALSRPTSYVYAGLISLIYYTGDLDRAVAVLQRLVEQKVRIIPIHLTKILAMCRRHKQWAKGLSIVPLGDHLDNDRGFLAEKIGIYSYSGEKIEAAEDLMARLVEGRNCSPQAYTLLVCGLIMHNKLPQAQRWFDQFDARYTPNIPNVAIYHAMINGYIRNHHLAAAVTLLKRLAEHSLPIQPSTAGNLLVGLIDDGNISEALEWYCWLRDNSHEPQRSLFGKILGTLAYNNNTEAAWSLWTLASTSRKAVNDATNDLLFSLNRKRELEKAQTVIEFLLSKNHLLKNMGFSHYLSNLVMANRVDEALEQFQRFETMKKNPFPVCVYASFIRDLRCIGLEKEAQTLAGRVSSEHPAYETIAQALTEENSRWWVRTQFEHAKKLDEPLDDLLRRDLEKPKVPHVHLNAKTLSLFKPHKFIIDPRTRIAESDIWGDFAEREINRLDKVFDKGGKEG
ncbi:Pentatricopeptide repeat-containing protein, chloroplastic [Neolecta irregularis DAH-3]|uniref:Pentatricopeptide repeat-containing protein, chloroplastic n=1 Tax=Neolecta irregularis (strain DAH-3) TaxID=1198029 RepID=A0A1U7LL37_NEOID|nr:Pentatricopeptide repeat-containing protein, chloroplastic [Neolecta irregularis DAH-3]|eukprot:OLL23370.1 Pentatricopeptide repeat-containing protein, chloroplastic [Neolecta irregularis DAH-3]